MSEDVERDNGVERAGSDLQVERVGVHERRLRDVMPRKLDLHGRDVHACDPVTARELASARPPAATAELEHVRAGAKPRVEIAKPTERRRSDLSGPLGVS